MRDQMRYACSLATRLIVGCALLFSAGPVRAQQALIPVDDGPAFDSDGDSFVKAARNRQVSTQSHGRNVAKAVQRALANGPLVLTGGVDAPKVSSGSITKPAGSPDLQVNDPALDVIYSFPGFTRPFEESTQSETSVAVSGNHVLVGYNTSAGEPIVRIGNNLFATHIFLSGFSISHDDGATFSSGFIPPPPGSLLTFGDPSVGVDRAGNFYYSHLAGDQAGNTVIAVNKSTDNGTSWSPATVAFTDNGADKDWLAIGPDPAVPTRDNIYVTWTRFTNTGSRVMLSKSIDGAATFATSTLFAPTGDAFFSSFTQFTNPVVDQSNGRLYIPFLHFSFFDADGIRVLASNDGGATFNFLAFSQLGAPDPFAYLDVTPGELADCGTDGGFRNVLHQGPDLGGGRFGLPRYRFATRLVTQPAAAADRGRLVIAFQSSTSPFFGDPSAGSEIISLYSRDGGATWAAPVTVASSTASDPQHVHPSVSLGQNGNRVFVGYYVQQLDTQLRTDFATLHVDGNHLKLDGSQGLSTVSFDLTPSNNPRPQSGPFFTTHYDRTIVPGYDIGEYMSIVATGNNAVAAWGDNRNPWTGPADSVFPGTHAQADVFFRATDK